MHARILVVVSLLLVGALAPPQAPPAQTLMAEADGGGHVLSVEEAAGLPPTIQGGIGPGSALRMGVDGIQYICSASFLLRDPATATYYLSTAGHCLVRDAADPTPVTGATDPGKVKNRFDICISGCMNNGVGLGTFVSLVPSGDYHPVAYAVSGGIGADFGLLEIPSELHGHLRPELSQWGGPDAVADDAPVGALLAHYGHGTVVVPGVVGIVTRTPVDQGRVAHSAGSTAQDFAGVGHVTGGDSGSAASLAVVDASGVRGTAALGVITHSIIYVGAPLFYGTMLGYGMEVAAAHTGLVLELVPEGDGLTQTPNIPPGPTTVVNITAPADNATFTVGATVSLRGTAATDGAEPPAGTRIEVSIDDPAFSPERQVPVAGVGSWSTAWKTESATLGNHTVYVRAVDEAGASLADAHVRVILQEVPTAPQEPEEPEGPAKPAEPEPPVGEPAATAQSPSPTPTPADKHDAPANGQGAPGISWLFLLVGLLAATRLRR